MWADSGATPEALAQTKAAITSGAANLAQDVAPAYAAKRAVGELLADTQDYAFKTILRNAYNGIKDEMYKAPEVQKLFQPWDEHWANYYKARDVLQSTFESKLGHGYVADLTKALNKMKNSAVSAKVLETLHESTKFLPEAQQMIEDKIAASADYLEQAKLGAELEQVLKDLALAEEFWLNLAD